MTETSASSAASAGLGDWIRSKGTWPACGVVAIFGGLCCLAWVVVVIIIIVVRPWPGLPPPTVTPTATSTATSTRTPTWTSTVSPTITSTATVTPAQTATGTPTASPVPLTPTPTSTFTITPMPMDTPVPPTPTPAKEPKPSLSFHPDELRAEGCETSYSVTGTLKNHGGEGANWAANVEIGYEIVKGAEYGAQVQVSPDFWAVIGGNETVNYTITVDTVPEWRNQSQKEIKVRLYIAREDNRPGHHQTQAHFTIVNRCG